MTEQEKALVASQIAAEWDKPAIPTITKVQEADFFRCHQNNYNGYFAWLKYPDGLFEIWFIVDVRDSLADYDWYFEKIT